jgi:hypothetical protein
MRRCQRDCQEFISVDGVDQDDHSSRDRIPAAPTDGRTMCVRLWLQISDAWLYNDYTYTAL